ncbi:hypothetical protein NH14_023780 [Paraburkholderia sacchari]|uniref:DNA ligase D polymerase domain-containing protein n=2 Tax=Paraburkholderia sacchari TaxID=159450 RepID=A0A8T6ZHQ2_9BURK|nr:hypothetical protein [Paraburkholderia sacchari]
MRVDRHEAAAARECEQWLVVDGLQRSGALDDEIHDVNGAGIPGWRPGNGGRSNGYRMGIDKKGARTGRSGRSTASKGELYRFDAGARPGSQLTETKAVFLGTMKARAAPAGGRSPHAVNRAHRDLRLVPCDASHAPCKGARGTGMQDAHNAQAGAARTPTGARAEAADSAAQTAPSAPNVTTQRVPRTAMPRAPRSPRTSSGRHGTIGEVAGIRITSARRVIDVDSGTRKLDLVRYYARAAPWLLPHLRDRPVSLVRAPQGLGGELFFQRHSARAPIPEVTQHEGLDPGHPPVLSIDSLEALVHVAQMDAIELHTWNAVTADIEAPDRIVLDLDPDPALDWDRMIEAAQLTRVMLADLGLDAFCKTSGGKGLHIVVPLVHGTGWDEAKAFARAVAQRLASGWPTQFTATMGPEHRKKKIFVDYLRNVRGASTAVAYGVRARPGMGVSVPIAWDELADTTGGAQWTLANIDARLAHVKCSDPWANYARVRQSVSSELTLRLEQGAA